MSAHQSAARRSRRSRMSQATAVALRPVAKACARNRTKASAGSTSTWATSIPVQTRATRSRCRPGVTFNARARGDVTVLQLSAAAFGTGWPFYVATCQRPWCSFGRLPVLMQLLAKDHRLTHMFAFRVFAFRRNAAYSVTV